jgi:hypothetical protein
MRWRAGRRGGDVVRCREAMCASLRGCEPLSVGYVVLEIYQLGDRYAASTCRAIAAGWEVIGWWVGLTYIK